MFRYLLHNKQYLSYGFHNTKMNEISSNYFAIFYFLFDYKYSFFHQHSYSSRNPYRNFFFFFNFFKLANIDSLKIFEKKNTSIINLFVRYCFSQHLKSYRKSHLFTENYKKQYMEKQCHYFFFIFKYSSIFQFI